MNLKSLLLVSAFVAVGSAHAVTLAYYNFNGGTAGAPNLAASSTATGVASTLTTTNANPSAFTGTTLNAQNGAPAGNDFAVLNGTNGTNNGSSVLVSLSASAQSLSNVGLSFATRRTSAGFNNIQLAYSTNGTTFTNFGGNLSATNTTYVVKDSGAISAINAAQNVLLRLTFTGGSTDAKDNLGNSRLDNLVVSGDVQAVPEPASMAALGLGALAFVRRRRASK